MSKLIDLNKLDKYDELIKEYIEAIVPTEVATHTTNGLMSATDKVKSDGLSIVQIGEEPDEYRYLAFDGKELAYKMEVDQVWIGTTAEYNAQKDNIGDGIIVVLTDDTRTTVVATTTRAGMVKPDGTTITVDADGTIHSAGGAGSVKFYYSSTAPTTDLVNDATVWIS